MTRCPRVWPCACRGDETCGARSVADAPARRLRGGAVAFPAGWSATAAEPRCLGAFDPGVGATDVATRLTTRRSNLRRGVGSTRRRGPPGAGPPQRRALQCRAAVASREARCPGEGAGVQHRRRCPQLSGRLRPRTIATPLRGEDCRGSVRGAQAEAMSRDALAGRADRSFHRLFSCASPLGSPRDVPAAKGGHPLSWAR
jgi:hypothetical protein